MKLILEIGKKELEELKRHGSLEFKLTDGLLKLKDEEEKGTETENFCSLPHDEKLLELIRNIAKKRIKRLSGTQFQFFKPDRCFICGEKLNYKDKRSQNKIFPVPSEIALLAFPPDVLKNIIPYLLSLSRHSLIKEHPSSIEIERRLSHRNIPYIKLNGNRFSVHFSSISKEGIIENIELLRKKLGIDGTENSVPNINSGIEKKDLALENAKYSLEESSFNEKNGTENFCSSGSIIMELKGYIFYSHLFCFLKEFPWNSKKKLMQALNRTEQKAEQINNMFFKKNKKIKKEKKEINTEKDKLSIYNTYSYPEVVIFNKELYTEEEIFSTKKEYSTERENFLKEEEKEKIFLNFGCFLEKEEKKEKEENTEKERLFLKKMESSTEKENSERSKNLLQGAELPEEENARKEGTPVGSSYKETEQKEEGNFVSLDETKPARAPLVTPAAEEGKFLVDPTISELIPQMERDSHKTSYIPYPPSHPAPALTLKAGQRWADLYVPELVLQRSVALEQAINFWDGWRSYAKEAEFRTAPEYKNFDLDYLFRKVLRLDLFGAFMTEEEREKVWEEEGLSESLKSDIRLILSKLKKEELEFYDFVRKMVLDPSFSSYYNIFLFFLEIGEEFFKESFGDTVGMYSLAMHKYVPYKVENQDTVFAARINYEGWALGLVYAFYKSGKESWEEFLEELRKEVGPWREEIYRRYRFGEIGFNSLLEAGFIKHGAGDVAMSWKDYADRNNIVITDVMLKIIDFWQKTMKTPFEGLWLHDLAMVSKFCYSHQIMEAIKEYVNLKPTQPSFVDLVKDLVWGKYGLKKSTIDERKDLLESSNYSVHFEKFWEVYPRKEDKQSAWREFLKAMSSGVTGEMLVEAAKKYKEEKVEKEKCELKFLKKPANFLRDGTYMSYIDLSNICQINEDEL